MAVVGFLCGGEFGESLLDLGEVEQGVVAEASGALQVVEDLAFGRTSEGG